MYSRMEDTSTGYNLTTEIVRRRWSVSGVDCDSSKSSSSLVSARLKTASSEPEISIVGNKHVPDATLVLPGQQSNLASHQM